MKLVRYRRVVMACVAVGLLGTACGSDQEQTTGATTISPAEAGTAVTEQPEEAQGPVDEAASPSDDEPPVAPASDPAVIKELLDEAASLRGDEPTVALLLALEAHRQSPEADTEQAVIETLVQAGVVSTHSIELAPPDQTGCGFPLADEDGQYIYQVTDGVLSRRGVDAVEVVEVGELSQACTWLGDLETGRATAGNTETGMWELGPMGEPFDATVDYDEELAIAGRAIRGNRVVFVAFGAGGVTMVIADATTGAVIAEVGEIADPSSITFGGDGTLIGFTTRVPGAGGQVILLDAETGVETLRVDLDESAVESRFDLTTGEIVMPTPEGRLVTLDIASGEVVADVPTAGTAEVVAVGIRPDGLVLIAREGQIEIMDRHSGPTGIAVEIGPSLAMRARPDGTVLKMNPDGTTEIVDPDANGLAGQSPEQWLTQACEIASRDLTDDEWDNHVPGGVSRQPLCTE